LHDDARRRKAKFRHENLLLAWRFQGRRANSFGISLAPQGLAGVMPGWIATSRRDV